MDAQGRRKERGRNPMRGSRQSAREVVGSGWSEREEGKGAALGCGWPARLGRDGPCAGGQGAGLRPTATEWLLPFFILFSVFFSKKTFSK